jgi:UDP-N-acetylmuramyl pentapeptide phosphotransferase/UDP-N-acetylglucosamine-1-phosphate transferase
MKSASIVGILLIVLGVIALTYQGITYTTKKKVLDIGPIQATKEEHKTIPLPPILGGIAIVGGIALLITGGKNS